MNFNLALVLCLMKVSNGGVTRNIKDSCDVDKTCILVPCNCTPFVDCSYFMSFAIGGDSVTVELSTAISPPQSSKQWVAVGFSEDDKMGNDSVVYCVTSSDPLTPTLVGLGYTTVIPRDITKLDDPNRSVMLVESAFVDSSYFCRFRRLLVPKTNDSRIISLNGSYYHVLLASGVADNLNQFDSHTVNRSDPKYPFVSSKFNMMRNFPLGRDLGREIQGSSPSAHTEDCQKTKGCLLKPPNCTPFVDCGYFVGYAPTPANDWITFELATKLSEPNKDHWVAVGFSVDNSMGDDAVSFCIYNQQTQTPVVGLAYNTASKEPVFVTDPYPSNPTLKMIKVLMVNGTLYCQFQQAVLPYAKNVSQIWPLNVPYYIFSASGNSNYPAELLPHSFEYNNQKYPFRSDVKILLTNVSIAANSSSQTSNYSSSSFVNATTLRSKNSANVKCFAMFIAHVVFTVIFMFF